MLPHPSWYRLPIGRVVKPEASIRVLSVFPRAFKSSKLPFLPALLVTAGVLCAWCLVAADACVRAGWPYFAMAKHVAGALTMYAGLGALLGLLVSALVGLEQLITAPLVRSRAGRFSTIRPLFYAGVGALASVDTARWTFSGEAVG